MRPASAARLVPAHALAIPLLALVVFAVACPAHAQAVRESTWVTDGTVNAIASTGSTVFIGGDFNQVGLPTGGGAVVDRGTGLALRPPLLVAGNVLAAAPDGSGGWYLGGQFTSVLGQPRANLAHVLSDGTLTDWAPGANAVVRALARVGSVVYAGGDFTVAGGLTRNHLVALDAASGVPTAWDPAADAPVTTMLVSGSTLYAGGSFRNISGHAAPGLVAFDLPGATLSATRLSGPEAGSGLSALAMGPGPGPLYIGGGFFNATPPTGAAAVLDPTSGAVGDPLFDVQGVVKALMSDGAGGWYLGGTFSVVRGQPRQNLAHVLADGTLAGWNPGASDTVQALAFANGAVFAGGYFTVCGGQVRASVAAIDAATGALLPWAPAFDGPVNALAVDGGRLYAGGSFSSVAGVSRYNLVAFDLPGGAISATQPWECDGPVRALTPSAGLVFVGGAFRLFAPPASGFVPLDAASGAQSTAPPGVTGTVYAVAADGSGGWYLGGSFSAVGGQPRNNLAHVMGDGSVAPWAPVVTGTVRAMRLTSGTLYVGGSLASVDGQSRIGLASFDAGTGALTSWGPVVQAGHSVKAMVMVGDTLYFGGDFFSVGGQSRGCGAAVHRLTGALTSFDALAVYTPGSAIPSINAMTFGLSHLYVQGLFDRLGGSPRTNIGALDPISGLAIAWSPTANALNYGALAISGDTLFVGGDLTTVTGQVRNGLAAIGALSATVLPWNPNLTDPTGVSFPPTVTSLLVSGGSLYAAGTFTAAGTQARGHVAAFDRGTGALRSWSPGTDGPVYALADAPGTVAIGGSFHMGGGFARRNATGFTSATSGGLFFNPDPNGPVNAIAVLGTAVYLGGEFTQMGGVSRIRLGAQDLNVGRLPWSATANRLVRALAIQGNTLYVGGDFSSVAATSRPLMAALDASTGAIAPWAPASAGGTSAYALVASGAGIAAGGDFGGIGGQARTNIAAIDPASGGVTSWKTAPVLGNVFAIGATSSSVFAGGSFSITTPVRNHAAAFDATTGATLPWNPVLEPTSNFSRRIQAIIVSSDTVFIAGEFTSISGQDRRRVAAVDAINGVPNAWTSGADNVVFMLKQDGGRMFVGGLFGSGGMLPRAGIAGLDAVTGDARSFAATLNGRVLSLAQDGGRLFVGGEFTTLNGALQERFAVLDTTTGAPLTGDLACGGVPYAIVPAGGRIYLGGTFSDFGGVARNRLLALDRSSLALLPWNPGANNQVTSLVVANGVAYTGGFFAIAGGATRRGLAAIDTSSGLATAWDPSPLASSNTYVASLALNGNNVYVGGNFTSIGGQARQGFASVDASSGLATTLAPAAGGAVNAIAISNGTVFLGGVSSLGGLARQGLGAFDGTTGSVLDWAPSTSSGSVLALSFTPGTMFIGGSFSVVQGEKRKGLAALADPSFNPLLDVTPRPARTTAFTLAQNSPNPFRASCVIAFTLPRAGAVRLSLIDPAGREVSRLLDGEVLDPGQHEVRVKGDGLRSGLYWYRLEWNGEVLARRMVAMP